MWILPIVFDLILPASYAPAKSILPYFVLGNAFLGMYYAVTNLVFFSSQTYRISKITLIVALLSVPLTYFLIRQYGIRGAGLSYAISQFFLFLLVWREGAKLFELPWREVKHSVGLVAGGRRHAR
jgi:O-antigen/teichoic acid export membrane protein